MAENKELSDEMLNNVTGGGDGMIPFEGIKYTEYDEPTPGRYYTTAPNNPNVVYLTQVNRICYYTEEELVLYGTAWYTMFTSPDCGSDTIEDFKKKYRYRLNIRP